jgi:hypothetical protein
MENESPAMAVEAQPGLLPGIKLWPRPEGEKSQDKPPARVKTVQRDQLVLRPMEVEQLLGPEHPARAIWELVGQCDLEAFYDQLRRWKAKRDGRRTIHAYSLAYGCIATCKASPRGGKSSAVVATIRRICG